jgi:hypothetical protein
MTDQIELKKIPYISKMFPFQECSLNGHMNPRIKKDFELNACGTRVNNQASLKCRCATNSEQLWPIHKAIPGASGFFSRNAMMNGFTRKNYLLF